MTPWRYLPYHARDVARAPLALYIAVATGLGLVLWRMSRLAESPPASDMLLRGFINGTLVVAVLFACGGVAGTDIKQGYYRAFFSKPMAPWWYYLQRWVLGGIALLTAPVWLGLAIQLALGNGTGLTWEVFGVVALGFLLIGGVVLLASTVTSRDWLVAFLVYFLQARLHDVTEILERAGQRVPRLVEFLDTVLPPFHLVNRGDGLPSGGELVHVLAYGAALVVAALLVLTYRPLGSGGRA
jgi:hypothetical protein